jgi:hypothetical protein
MAKNSLCRAGQCAATYFHLTWDRPDLNAADDVINIGWGVEKWTSRFRVNARPFGGELAGQ